MCTAIKAPHATIVLGPDAEIHRLSIDVQAGRENLSHVSPVHEVVGERARLAAAFLLADSISASRAMSWDCASCSRLDKRASSAAKLSNSFAALSLNDTRSTRAFCHVQQGRALRLIVGNTNITTDASRQAILKAIARARCWYEQITTGKATNIAELAGMDGVSPHFIRTQMKLVQLSPRSIESLMTRPESLPLSLDDLLVSIPMDWREQPFGWPAKSASTANQ